MITIRGLLEAGQHAHSIFPTFTYDERYIPGNRCVSMPVAQLLLKRIRYYCGPFRYIICGEYGERNWRPHYHAILFGLRDGRGLSQAWPYGHIHVSGVGPESIAYVAGYCLKGLTTEKGMRWAGRMLTPEFVSWSRVPPIGALAADRMGAFYTGDGAQVLEQTGDVSAVVRQGQKLWPIGRYLRERVRRVAGLDREVLSEMGQLSRSSLLKEMDQEKLNAHIDLVSGQSEASGFRTEAKYKRMSLEKKL